MAAVSIEPDHEAGFYRYSIGFAGKTFAGRAETRLLGVAVKRAKAAVNRLIREGLHVDLRSSVEGQ